MTSCSVSVRDLVHAAVRELPADSTTFVDVGCGSKRFASSLDLGALRYIGIDLDSEMATVQADVTALPLPAHSADLILMRAVMQYVRDRATALAECHRVLKPGGILIGSVAFLEPAVWGSSWHLTGRGLTSLLSSSPFRDFAIWPGWSVSNAIKLALEQRGALVPETRDALRILEDRLAELPMTMQLAFAASLNFRATA